MATQGPVVGVDLAAFSAHLLDSHELAPRTRLAAQAIAELLPGSGINVYLLGDQAGERVWTPQATVGEVAITESSLALEHPVLRALADKPEPLVLSGKKLVREEYSHLHFRRTLQSLAYLPLNARGGLLGTIEIVSFDGELGPDTLSAMLPLAEVTASALANAVDYEQERHSTLSSITRLTHLYDLEKVLNSTLELDQLLPLMGSKFKELLECQAVNVWLLESDESLTLMMVTGVGVSLLNLNPLIKLDGYLIFSELVAEPSLKETSTAYLTAWARKHLFRLPAEVPYVPRRKRPFYVVYGILSGMYSYSLLSFLMVITYHILRSYSPDWAFVPAFLIGVWVFRSRLKLLVAFMKTLYLDKKERAFKWFTPMRIGLVALGALIILLVPIWPDFVQGRFVLQAAQHA